MAYPSGCGHSGLWKRSQRKWVIVSNANSAAAGTVLGTYCLVCSMKGKNNISSFPRLGILLEIFLVGFATLLSVSGTGVADEGLSCVPTVMKLECAEVPHLNKL